MSGKIQKLCRECGKEYTGYPVSRFCKDHKDARKRKQVIEDITIDNQIFKHSFKKSTEVLFVCALEGCEGQFNVRIIPGIEIYPKYCEKHRVPFKRVIKKELV